MKQVIIPLIIFAVTISACAQKDDLVTIKTEYGDIKVLLFDDTPLHKENFLKLAKSGAYDSTIFHRIIQNFMIQGGDVNQKPGVKEKIEYNIPAEFISNHFHHKGALAAARQPDQMNPKKESSGCQFYIVQGNVWDKATLVTDLQKINSYVQQLAKIPGYEGIMDTLSMVYETRGNQGYGDKLFELKPVMEEKFGKIFEKAYTPEQVEAYTTVGGTPHLDGDYTVFGRVVEGLDVVDKIAAVSMPPGASKPMKNIYMTMEVEAIPVEKIKELYGDK